MRAAIEFLLPALLLIGFMWYMMRQYIFIKQEERKLTTVYFTGGPMNGEERRLLDGEAGAPGMPQQYTYLYTSAVMTSEDGNGAKVEQKESRVAVYTYDGKGTYAYQGSVATDSVAHPFLEQDLLKIVKETGDSK